MVTDLMSSAVMQFGIFIDSYGINSYIHSQHFFVSVCLKVVSEQPVCYEYLCSGFM